MHAHCFSHSRTCCSAGPIEVFCSKDMGISDIIYIRYVYPVFTVTDNFQQPLATAVHEPGDDLRVTRTPDKVRPECCRFQLF